MDQNWASVIVVTLLVGLAVVAFLVFRQRGQAEVTGPFGTGVKVSGSRDVPPPTPGVVVEDATSRAGALRAEDHTGRGTAARRVDVQGDITATAAGPDAGADPKGPPPTQ